jgi:transposase
MNVIAGIDVSKQWLDVVWAGEREVKRFGNNRTGCMRLVRRLLKAKVTLVVVESTGGYERLLCRLLWASQIPVSVVNPRWVRSFAASIGWKAKSDPIDAELLMEYGKRNNPDPTPAVPEVIEQLRGYLTRRDQLNAMLVMEKNHASSPTVALELRRKIRRSIVSIRSQIKEIDCLIKEAIETSPEIHSKAQKLREQTGVGPVLMTSLIADVPELGRVRRNVASALVGVAPFDQDSGTFKGRRAISGGRARPRKALYMATLAAIRHDPHLKTFYLRLLSAGKPRKVAIVACMRKFLVHLNSILRQDPQQHFMAQ